MKLAVIVVLQQVYVVAIVGHVFTFVLIVAYASIQDGTISITLSCGRYESHLVLINYTLYLLGWLPVCTVSSTNTECLSA